MEHFLIEIIFGLPVYQKKNLNMYSVMGNQSRDILQVGILETPSVVYKTLVENCCFRTLPTDIPLYLLAKDLSVSGIQPTRAVLTLEHQVLEYLEEQEALALLGIASKDQ